LEDSDGFRIHYLAKRAWWKVATRRTKKRPHIIPEASDELVASSVELVFAYYYAAHVTNVRLLIDAPGSQVVNTEEAHTCRVDYDICRLFAGCGGIDR
jgi:hypothetical protein